MWKQSPLALGCLSSSSSGDEERRRSCCGTLLSPHHVVHKAQHATQNSCGPLKGSLIPPLSHRETLNRLRPEETATHPRGHSSWTNPEDLACVQLPPSPLAFSHTFPATTRHPGPQSIMFQPFSVPFPMPWANIQGQTPAEQDTRLHACRKRTGLSKVRILTNDQKKKKAKLNDR